MPDYANVHADIAIDLQLRAKTAPNYNWAFTYDPDKPNDLMIAFAEALDAHDAFALVTIDIPVLKYVGHRVGAERLTLSQAKDRFAADVVERVAPSNVYVSHNNWVYWSGTRWYINPDLDWDRANMDADGYVRFGDGPATHISKLNRKIDDA